ncbi:MAG: hypothetical protein Q8R55_00445 [Candidatus Taylorbacteria bacterium]|nr:hypothetical protein [Candidatus Taylorbacteria bacterium]
MTDKFKEAILTDLRKLPNNGKGWECLGSFIIDVILENDLSNNLSNEEIQEEIGKAITFLVKDGLIEIIWIDLELGIKLA